MPGSGDGLEALALLDSGKEFELVLSNLMMPNLDGIGLLGEALGMKDSATEGHSKRVTAFAIEIARAMGLPKDQITVIVRGAFLHDIGKMAIPRPILLKPGALTPEETAVMRQHCIHGYKLLHAHRFYVARSSSGICLQRGSARRSVAKVAEYRAISAVLVRISDR